MKAIWALVVLWIGAVAAWAQATAAPKCKPDEILVAINFQFRDTDVRQDWVYRSLSPTLNIASKSLSPVHSHVSDGTAKYLFCGPADIQLLAQFEFQAGPRRFTLATRPIGKNARGQDEMSLIRLHDQPRPNWVIVKSFTRIMPINSELPAFDLELVNFGEVHVGGSVRFTAEDKSRRCGFASPVSKVPVEVAVAGQRLKIASADPQFPEDLISRQAELVQNLNQCAGNFRLDTELGPTGSLPPGPSRIRYTLRHAVAKHAGGSSSSAATANYFMRGFSLTVIGDDIWQGTQ